MAEAHGHHDYLRHDILIDVATPQLYRANAFRVLGLSVTVDGAEMSRQQKKLKMLAKLGGTAAQNHSGVLPLMPPPDSDALRTAGQRFHDMPSRLVDELFWFWPSDGAARTDDSTAFEMLRRNDIEGAQRCWSELAIGNPTEFRAKHNLAVLNHSMALDIEYAAESQSDLLGSDILNLCEKYWQTALGYWNAATADESLWTHVASRAEALDDPRLTSGFVRRLRHSLPAAIMSISINFAVRAAKRGDVDQARRHLLYIRESGFDLHLAASVLEREASPLVEQIRRICEPVAERSKAAPDKADQLAKSVLKDCQALLTGIRAILGKEHHLRQTAFDLVASTVRGCMIDYGNETENWGACIPMLEHAAGLALDCRWWSKSAHSW